jgi:hypothetical protein
MVPKSRPALWELAQGDAYGPSYPQDGCLRNPDQLRRSHVAPPTPHGVEPAEALIAIG